MHYNSKSFQMGWKQSRKFKEYDVQQEEKFLTADEAAHITGLHPTTIRKLAWQRKIRSFKVLGAVRFKRQDLEELIVERPAKVAR